jgi:thiamine-phosphate pyrophosphorylase
MPAPFDLSLYLITDPELCAAKGVVEVVERAVGNGASMVQLRDRSTPRDALVQLARSLLNVLRPFRVPLIINDRVDVALLAGAHGVHVGQTDMPVREARALLGPDHILGLSVGTLSELERSELRVVDYIGVGPVFATGTKPDAGAPIGLPGLRAVARRAGKPSVAIGGIHPHNAAAAIEHGAHGIAVVSAICGQPDPGAAARELAQIVRGARARTELQ